MAIWLNLFNSGKTVRTLYFDLDREKNPHALASKKMKKFQTGMRPYVIEALAEIEEGRDELADLAKTAFEMGREYQQRKNVSNIRKKQREFESSL